METHLFVVAGVLLALGFFAAIMTLTRRVGAHAFSWNLTGVLAFLGGSIAAFFAFERLPKSDFGLKWIAGTLIVLGAIFWTALLMRNRKSAGGRGSFQRQLRFARQVALPDWQEMDTSHLRAIDRREESRLSLLLNVGAALVILPGITGVLAASIAMNIRGNKDSDFLSHAIGFYVLLIATCWTVSYFMTILVVSLVQTIRGNGRQLTLGAVAISVGTWAGLGAAGGVLVGALIPLVVIPLSRGQFEMLGVSLLDAISPNLLLDISTAGAVFGFLLGEIISLISIAGGEKNLFLKCSPPLLFASIATGLGFLGLTPGKLSHYLAKEYRSTILTGENAQSSDPFDLALSEGLDSQVGWAAAVVGIDDRGWNQMVDYTAFYAATWIIAIMVTLFTLVIGIGKREAALLAEDGKVAAKVGAPRPEATPTRGAKALAKPAEVEAARAEPSAEGA